MAAAVGPFLIRGSLEDDRRDLALCRAAFSEEVGRLGRAQGALLSRPPDMGGEGLVRAASAADAAFSSSSADGVPPDDVAAAAHGARDVLLSSPEGGDEGGGTDGWEARAREWSGRVRLIIHDLVTETSAASNRADAVSGRREEALADDMESLARWASSSVRADGGLADADDGASWDAALSLVEGLSKPRRAGEGGSRRRRRALVTPREAARWARANLDFGGLTSTAAILGLAHAAHEILSPRWSSIVDFSRAAAGAIWGVVDVRFWRPLRDIALDLLNRRPHLLDPYALANEQRSLDAMLRDLGLGDGTPRGRIAGIEAAARKYEEELAGGAIRNLVRGDMVRLLLVQIQQLKAGGLQALGSIDDLVDKNRLNVQLLAAIPAALLVTFGTRAFFVAVFSFRTGSGRVKQRTEIQEDMNDCLRRIEWRLLMSGQERVGAERGGEDGRGGTESSVGTGVTTGGGSRPATPLPPDELGEFVLLVHSYLLLLDYASPPVPAKVSDELQTAVQEMVGGTKQGEWMSTLRQLRLLGVIKSKNADLIKSYF